MIGLSEVKRIGEEIQERDRYVMFYYGITRRRASVGFIVKSKWKQNIRSFSSYSDRVVALNLKINENDSCVFIQYYAPTSTAPDSEIDKFYDEVSRAINVKDKSKELKWQWAGHFQRHTDNERWPKLVESWNPKGRRRTGRPKTRWKDENEKTGSIFWRRKALNRELWKKIVKTLSQF